MIKVEPCRGCGRIILVGKIANLTVKCDPAPLTNVGDIMKLLTSASPTPTLWMVEQNLQGQPIHLRGARPGEAGPVAEHRCTVSAQEALSRPRTPAPVSSPQPTPQSPPAGRTAPFSGPSAGPSSVRGAGTLDSKPSGASLRSSDVPCSVCGNMIHLTDVGTYALIELGAVLIDAFHTGGCS